MQADVEEQGTSGCVLVLAKIERQHFHAHQFIFLLTLQT